MDLAHLYRDCRVVGAVTIRNPGIFVFQSLPALAALVLIWVDRPYPRTEQEATRDIIQIEHQILALKSVDEEARKLGERGAVPRGQHPKLHGLVRAEFTIAEDIPDKEGWHLREPGRTYEALIRFSNARNADDRDRGGHGMAVKLFNIPGDKIGDKLGSVAQDFVLFDQPVFFVGNPIQYVEFEEATLRVRQVQTRHTGHDVSQLLLAAPPSVPQPVEDAARRRD